MAPGTQTLHELNPDARMVDGVLRYPAPGDGQGRLFAQARAPDDEKQS
jgi:hypothetical protein